MRNGTRLRVTCGRCGQDRELIGHVCVVRSGRAARRRATPELKLDFGKCGNCSKRVGNPLTHVCKPRSDFKSRKAKAGKAAKPKRQQRDKHDYLTCKDTDCPRPLCAAYRTGWREGHRAGFDEGYDAGYARGFPDGIAACPLPHK
jgi:hypothetical protein